MGNVNPPWNCDICGKRTVTCVSNDPNYGYVYWQADDPSTNYRNFVVAHQKCGMSLQRETYNQSLPLESFLGDDGLTKIMSWLSVGKMALDRGDDGFTSKIGDYDKFVDFVRRMQIPHYDNARTSWNPHKDDSARREDTPYKQETLKRITSGG